MSLTFIKEPCCENFCLSTGGTSLPLSQYFSNLNLYVKPVINDILISNPDPTKYTWNNITSSYEPIWEWRGFIRTFPVNGDSFPIRLIQSSPQHQGLVWFLQVRNWTTNVISQSNDYGILAYYENTINNVNNYPVGDFILNDGLIVPTYVPTTTTPLNSLIATSSQDPISLSSGYCNFISS